MRGTLRLPLLAGLITVFAAPVLAQVPSAPARIPCHEYKELARQLSARYEEAPVSMGMQANGNLLQVFASKEKDSWTILSVSPTGLGCILAAGKGWQDFGMPATEPEA